MPEVSFNLVTPSQIIGINVVNTNGEDLGQIEDIVIDKITGTVQYIVLSFGGYLGYYQKLFAIPWSSIKYELDDDKFLLKIHKSDLENLFGFDKEEWPDVSSPKLIKLIDEYYTN